MIRLRKSAHRGRQTLQAGLKLNSAANGFRHRQQRTTTAFNKAIITGQTKKALHGRGGKKAPPPKLLASIHAQDTDTGM
jgi:hypothetical protein